MSFCVPGHSMLELSQGPRGVIRQVQANDSILAVHVSLCICCMKYEIGKQLHWQRSGWICAPSRWSEHIIAPQVVVPKCLKVDAMLRRCWLHLWNTVPPFSFTTSWRNHESPASHLKTLVLSAPGVESADDVSCENSWGCPRSPGGVLLLRQLAGVKLRARRTREMLTSLM
jgi:hypothetical protein